MLKKDLHITFGFSGETILTQSKIIDDAQGEICNFRDQLALGPLCDLDNIAIENRKRWFQKLFGSIPSEGEDSFIDDDLNLLKKLIDTSNRYENIYLWLGGEANEKITTARLLFHLQGISVPMYRLNFDKMEFRNKEGVKLDLTSLQAMTVENIPEVSRYFEELSKEDKRSFVSIWDNLLTDKSVIHLYDKSGNYVSGDETFFDEYLLNRCNETPQRSSLIVAYTLFDIWEKFGGGSIGDRFLFHRLNELGNMGKIEISSPHENADRAKLVFDVKEAD